MPYKYVEPEVAVEIDRYKIFYTYKGEDSRLSYWFAEEMSEAEEGGRQFDIREQDVWGWMEQCHEFFAQLKEEEEDKYIQLCLAWLAIQPKDIKY